MHATALAAATLLAGVPAVASSAWARAYSTRPAGYQAQPRFAFNYAGSGRFATTYMSEPPNQGGKPDHNRAHDSSTQTWSLSYGEPLTIPRCGPSPHDRGPSCRRITSLIGATGATTASDSIAHVHIDGLYRVDNVSLSCRQHVRTPRGQPLMATFRLRYDPVSNALSITALDPVSYALDLLPGTCPGQGDPIDGLDDSYATPGFSFSPLYGPDRWFTSRTVVVPMRVLHRSALVTIRLRETGAGTPPRHCAVLHPSYEQCSTGGSWSGVLVMRRG
jgi:hypothetical protein